MKNSPLNYIDPSGHKKQPSEKKKVEDLSLQDLYEMTPEYWNEEAAREAYGGLNDSKIAEYLSKGKMSKLLSQAEKKLASLMKKAEKLTDSLSEKCDAFNKGMSSGREAALKIIDNLLIGNLMHELGSDMGYTSQEELNEIYLSGFDEVAETEDNVWLYNWGCDAGGIAALIDLIGILSALTLNAGGTQKGTTKVPVQGADGKQYMLEVPDEALMADGTLNPAIISQMQGETGNEEDSESTSDAYKAPGGGGGVTDNIKVGNKEVTFGHGGRHLEGTNLSATEVNQAIANDVVSKNPGVGQFYKGQVNVNGVNIEYTSYGVKDAVINIGTYYLK